MNAIAAVRRFCYASYAGTDKKGVKMGKVYLSADGKIFTDEQVDAWCEAYERGEFPKGETMVGGVCHGRPDKFARADAGQEVIAIAEGGIPVSGEMIQEWCAAYDAGELPAGYEFDGPLRPGRPKLADFPRHSQERRAEDASF